MPCRPIDFVGWLRSRYSLVRFSNNFIVRRAKLPVCWRCLKQVWLSSINEERLNQKKSLIWQRLKFITKLSQKLLFIHHGNLFSYISVSSLLSSVLTSLGLMKHYSFAFSYCYFSFIISWYLIMSTFLQIYWIH